MALRAAVFDMDGVLVDSEPLWQEAEIEVFGTVGVELTRTMCEETMGLRIDEAVAHWHGRTPWDEPSQPEIADRIVAGVAALIADRGEPLPGVDEALDACRRRGLRLALASSSPMPLIQAVLERFDLRRTFEVVVSADAEPYGKPHPGIYLTAAGGLDVAPTVCVAIEDSLNGVIAAKAARMRAVAIPADPADPRFGVADAVITSLAELDGVLS